MTTTVTPRIYVADLAEYVAGNLVGEWFDPEDFGYDADELGKAIESKVLRKAQTGHEEWAIHDFEGFGPIRVGEYDSLATVCAHAERMSDDNAGKYAAWIDARGEAEGFDPDLVHGPYESESEYFDQYLDGVFGGMDVETVLINSGVDSRTASSLASMLEWVDVDRFMRDNGNPLTEVSTGEYSREFYEVEES